MTTSQTQGQAAGDVRDRALANEGIRRIDWAAREMPVLASIRERFAKDQPLRGIRIGACLHITTETANLLIALKAGGAEVTACASNPLSTQDDVAASLVANSGMATFSIKGENENTYYGHIKETLSTNPQLTMDDGADLVSVLHKGEA